MSTISSSGIGSGIDVNSLVDNIIKSQSEAKEKSLTDKEKTAQNKISAYGRIRSSLEDFQSSLSDLKNTSKFNVRSATVTNSTASTSEYFKATANSSAINATYGIEVQQIATSAKLTSKAFTSESTVIGTGNLNITVDGVTSIISIDGTNNSLFQIKKAINQADAGVVATSLIADDGARLVITAKETGLENAITITVDNDGDLSDSNDGGLSQLINANMTEIAAKDAIIQIDGNTVTRASNTITGAIDGITIDAKIADTGNVHTLTVNLDTDAATESIDKFIDAYNNMLDVFNELSGLTKKDELSSTSDSEDSSTTTEDLNAVLQGDYGLRTIEGKFNKIINEVVGSTGGFQTLSQIGIVSNYKTGKLEKSLNTTTFEERLTEALSSNFDSVGELFGNETYGVAKRLDDYITDDLLSSSGLISMKTRTFNNDINMVLEDRGKLITRLESLEALLYKKFSAMDAVVANLRNTGNYLSETLAQAPVSNSSKQKG